MFHYDDGQNHFLQLLKGCIRSHGHLDLDEIGIVSRLCFRLDKYHFNGTTHYYFENENLEYDQRSLYFINLYVFHNVPYSYHSYS